MRHGAQVCKTIEDQAQARKLNAYCQAQGWKVAPDRMYVDAGLSGKSTDRAAFQAMMSAARNGEIQRIVAVKLARIALNIKDFLGIVEELRTVGCDLVLIKESFDTSTPHGKFALTMFAAMAELEASTITARVMSGKAQCPLGYQYTNGVFTVEEGAAYWVREMFNRFVMDSL